MSQWTHVAGVIRFDGLRLPGFPHEHPREFMGTPSDWDIGIDAKDIPCGSEGSLEWHLWENPMLNALAAYTVSVFGDLRDYDDANEIVAYFKRITSGRLRLVRQATFTIDVEGLPERTWAWTDSGFVELFTLTVLSQTQNPATPISDAPASD